MVSSHQNQKTRRAVAYTRISSERQINGESPETQIATIQAYSDREGIKIEKVFHDEAKTGKNTDRAEVQNMLSYLKQRRGEIDYVIVYSMSRASRDIISYVTGFLAPLKALGVSVRSATEPVDDSAYGQFMEGFNVLVAQLDNQHKRDFTVDNMTALAHQGYWQAPPVLGYSLHKVQNENGKMRPTLKPDAKAPLVKQVLERFSEGGITKAELTRYAKVIGLRSRYGKVLSETGIHKLIAKPVYAGYIQNSFTEGQLVPGKHTAIISKETYDRNQRLLYGTRKRLGEVRQKLHPDYPLKGTVMCPNCGKPMYASAPRSGSGSKSPRYDCFRQGCKGHVRSIKAVSMHDSFEELLERIQPAEPVLELFREVVIERMTHDLGSLNSKKAAVNRKLETLSDNRLEVLKKYSNDKFTDEEKNDLIGSIDEDREELTKELSKIEAQQNIQEKDVDLAVAVMRDTKLQWQISSPFAKQKFQSALFPEGLVYDADNKRFGTTKISALYRVLPSKKDSEESPKSILVAGRGFEPLTSWL